MRCENIHQVFNLAADIIEHNGHIKGIFTDKDTGACCLVGAVYVACDELGVPRDGAVHLIVSEFETVTGNTRGPYLWNDAPERTPQEVISVLRQIAERSK